MGMLKRLLGDPPTCPDCGYHFPYLAGSIFTNPILHISGKPITCPQCRSTTFGEQRLKDMGSFKRENQKKLWDDLKLKNLLSKILFKRGLLLWLIGFVLLSILYAFLLILDLLIGFLTRFLP